jgi:ParB-like chromosome segregation protein Spo0J
MSQLEIIYLPLDAITPRTDNPRTHNRHQRRKLAKAIRRFGFGNPILIDERGGIIGGHCRYDVAKEIGLETIPTICLKGLPGWFGNGTETLTM